MSSHSAVELKGSMYTFLSLKLHTNLPAELATALADKVQQAPGFFANTPVVVDLTQIEDLPDTDAATLLQVIRESKLIPVVASISNRDCTIAMDIDIPLVEAGKKISTKNDANAPARQNEKRAPSLMSGHSSRSADGQAHDSDNNKVRENANDSEESALERTRNKIALDSTPDIGVGVQEIEFVTKVPKLVNKPIRSGQQVYARHTDLVVLGPIGPGAEIIADNHIHVYGALRGRALCGVAGNTEARIFCQSLEAELVSVAGNYKVLEEIPEQLRGKPAQIWYENDKLMIEPL